ncbi:MAG TPA: hypothetical protein DCZ03_01040 [Gammaproteobacteria bacterium]|nr:hypothetical protein [Gammaproteobacteria bacterium]
MNRNYIGVKRVFLFSLLLLFILGVEVQAQEQNSPNAEVSAAAVSANTQVTSPEEEIRTLKKEIQTLHGINKQLINQINLINQKLSVPKTKSKPTNGASSVVDGEGSQKNIRTTASPSREDETKPPTTPTSELTLAKQPSKLRPQSLELGFNLSHFDRSQLQLNGFLALDAIFLGDISIDETDSDIFTTSVTSRWVFTDRLQVSLSVPWVHRETTIRSGGQELSSVETSEVTVRDESVGDANINISLKLLRETDKWPDLVWNTTIISPTGSDPYGIDYIPLPNNDNLQVPERLPTGSGLWAVQTGFSTIHTTDPAILFASIVYRYYLSEEFDDLGSDPEAEDSPGEVQLGEQFQIGFGMALAINARTSMNMSFTQRFVDETEIERVGFGIQQVTGSSTSTGSFDIGVTHGLSPNISLVTNLGIGLTNDASDYRFSFNLINRLDGQGYEKLKKLLRTIDKQFDAPYP